jgi:hypothetical protein
MAKTRGERLKERADKKASKGKYTKAAKLSKKGLEADEKTVKKAAKKLSTAKTSKARDKAREKYTSAKGRLDDAAKKQKRSDQLKSRRNSTAKKLEDAMRKDEISFRNSAIDKIENAQKNKYENITRMEAAKLQAKAKRN